MMKSSYVTSHVSSDRRCSSDVNVKRSKQRQERSGLCTHTRGLYYTDTDLLLLLEGFHHAACGVVTHTLVVAESNIFQQR